ncbi:MAG: hypothetical protein OXL98_04635 [Acidimicrobiaceae bacterium]|nr:hypothetical protein [Acidimicrobiaceae bacterium]
MRAVVGWISAGTLLAVCVLGAVSAQSIPGVAAWVVACITVAAGLGALAASVESAPRPDAKALLLSILRSMLSVAAGAVTLLSAVVAGCDDPEGVPSWERCDTWLGTPAVDWPGAPLLALALSLGVGHLAWRLFGRVFSDRVD